MGILAWPLERNHIRRSVANNAFGMVRNGGKRAHQGWDLVAAPWTPCYAIADGQIEAARRMGKLGNVMILRFEHRNQTLYAAFCHLSMMLFNDGEQVVQGDVIGYTGNTGNAAEMVGEDQHLHFEIRTEPTPPSGLANRIDPATLYGRAPVGWTFFEGHGHKIRTAGVTGLKVPGVNMRERIAR